MQTTDLSNLHNYDDVYGTLWLPSVKQHGDTIRVENITLKEAIDMITDFNTRVEMSHKTKYFSSDAEDDPTEGYLLVNEISNKSIDVERLVTALSKCTIPTFRGVRPVFVSDALSAIVVGCGVIYNKNWAALSVLDSSLKDIITQVENTN